jgi:hypothetical protein
MKKLFVLFALVCLASCTTTRYEATNECMEHCGNHGGLNRMESSGLTIENGWCNCKNGIYFTNIYSINECKVRCKSDGGIKEDHFYSYFCYCYDGAQKYCR